MEKKVEGQAKRLGLTVNQLKQQAIIAMREHNRVSVLT
jgi:hypothetical protein